MRRSFGWLVGLQLLLGVSVLLQVMNSPWGEEPRGDEDVYLTWAQAVRFGMGSAEAPWWVDPLYPWLLAGSFHLSSFSFLAPRVMSLVFFVSAFALLLELAGRVFGPRAQIATGIVWLLSAGTSLSQVSIGPTALVMLLFALALRSLFFAWNSESPRRWFAAGLTSGLASLGSGALLALVPLLLLLPLRRPLAPLQKGIVWLALVGGLLVTQAPASAMSLESGGGLLPHVSQLGPTLFTAWRSESQGTGEPPAFVRRPPMLAPLDFRDRAVGWAHQPLLAEEVSAVWSAAAREQLLEDPLHALFGLPWKALLLFNAHTFDLREPFPLACTRRFFVPLTWLNPFTLGPALLLAAIAAWVRRHTLPGWLLGAFVSLSALMLLTSITTFERTLLWVPAVLLAGAAASSFSARATAISLAVGGGLALLPLPPVTATRAQLSACAADAGESLIRQGRVRDARDVLRSGFAAGEPTIKHRQQLGVAEYTLRNYAEAERLIGEALALNPGNELLRVNLAQTHFQQQRWAEVIALLGQKPREVRPLSAAAGLQRLSLLRLGQIEAADALLLSLCLEARRPAEVIGFAAQLRQAKDCSGVRTLEGCLGTGADEAWRAAFQNLLQSCAP